MKNVLSGLRNPITEEKGRSLQTVVLQAEAGWQPAGRQGEVELLVHEESENQNTAELHWG